MASEKSALKNERLALSALPERRREREREMNGIVIHSKVNENPRSLLVCQHEEDIEAAEIRAADAIKSNCLLF